jgi:hypothetical protein
MRSARTAVTLLLLALAVGTSTADADVVGPAKVRLVDPEPVALRGVGFAPNERVRLTVSLGESTIVRRLRASRAGAFTTVFGAIRFDRCSGSLGVKAVGSRGSRVAWELVPLECPAEIGAS